MLEVIIAAPASGSGKTSVTCGLLQALKDRGLHPAAFKCGPDYIDPMFHRSVLQVPSRNLDVFLAGEERVRGLYHRHTAGCGAAVCEGVMGFYDGMTFGGDRASAWDVARLLELPVLLVLHPCGSSLTLAAQVKGMLSFRKDSRIRGLFLNRCSAGLYAALKPMLEEETGVPVLGYLPELEQASLSSRHLGLVTAGEVEDLAQRVRAIAACLETTLDWPRFLAVYQTGRQPEPAIAEQPCGDGPMIAVARDEAFQFYYEESLDALRRAGAQLRVFSPLHDTALPAGAAGLYLGGGYPELHARALSENRPMRHAIRAAVEQGMPTVAECGGFLYLGQSLEDANGEVWPMVGVLPGEGHKTGGLVRFGYNRLTAQSDSMLLRTGETTNAHEFHCWDSTENGAALQAEKTSGDRRWNCCFATQSLYAGFPHLYLAGDLPLAERFAAAAKEYAQREEKEA